MLLLSLVKAFVSSLQVSVYNVNIVVSCQTNGIATVP